ncbi:hypothetical protein [Campylobacter hyointestinalis]|uniref:hypothetical protein n=1 Tax=Campylobacter hyointestinalis TaxID=198 RepID=UPI0011619CCD|nr:hypothetical protein [Campylobacter hyointestinalis]
MIHLDRMDKFEYINCTATQIIKNHLSYKLGEALINADKSKLGYLSLWFKCKKITKEHKKAKNENLKFI